MKTLTRMNLRPCGCITRSLPWLALLLVALLPAHAQLLREVEQGTEQAALDGDWTKVAFDLDAVTPRTHWVVQRMLKAYACLMLGRTNETSALVASLDSLRDLDRCVAWSEELVRYNPWNLNAILLHHDTQDRRDDFAAEIQRALATVEALVRQRASTLASLHPSSQLHALLPPPVRARPRLSASFDSVSGMSRSSSPPTRSNAE